MVSDSAAATYTESRTTRTVGCSRNNCEEDRAGIKLSCNDHSKQASARLASAPQITTNYCRKFNENESLVHANNNNVVKVRQMLGQPKQQKFPTITWNQYQHLYQGQGKTKQELARMFHDFRAQERTFKWEANYQIEFSADGQLIMSTPAGREAMKTGLFDEEGNLRQRPDQIPWIVFKSKMQQMNIDPKMASAMRSNFTGSIHLNADHLKTSNYRQHIRQHESPQRYPRDADHVLEPQICVPHLQQTKMNNYNFKVLREELNSENNIESRGKIENRQVKRNANRGIAINKPHLNVATYEQERVQASQARLIAQKCRTRGAFDAARVLETIAEKCDQLNKIHGALHEIKKNTSNGKSTKNSDHTALIQQIISYERKYGTLEFRGGNVTKQHREIFAQAHQQEQ